MNQTVDVLKVSQRFIWPNIIDILDVARFACVFTFVISFYTLLVLTNGCVL